MVANRLERQSYNQEPWIMPLGRKIVQYEQEFDAQKYQSLSLLKYTNPETYLRKKQELNSYTVFNLETALGERFNTSLSRRRDEIINGELCAANSGEPLLVMFERGRDYRKQNGSSNHDQLREQAEVDGFAQIQKVLTDENTPLGTIMLSISPPGDKDSIYKHNFYDIFTLCQDERGRYIDVRRYGANLNIDEYIGKIKGIDPHLSVPPKIDDVNFLSNPLWIHPVFGLTPESLHKYFNKGGDYMTQEDFQYILKAIKPFISRYLKCLDNTPYNKKDQELALKAIFNFADEVYFNDIKNGKGVNKSDLVYQTSRHIASVASEQDMYKYGMRQTRSVNTGCGDSILSLSGESQGSSMGILGSVINPINSPVGPYSVAEFGMFKTSPKSQETCNKITCRKCPWEASEREVKKIQEGKLTCCPKCGWKP